MHTLDVACLKAYVTGEDDYRALLSSVGESVWACLPGFKGPFFRPCIDVPQSILEARAAVGNTELVIRSLNNMSCSQAIITTSDPGRIPAEFDMISHKFKEVQLERVWASNSTIQHRCTITCEYVIMDDMRELIAFWEPLAAALFPAGKKYSLRCYREANKDFFFHDYVRIINIRNTLQIVDTVNPVPEEEVAPQTAFEVSLELSAANEQGDEHLVMRLVDRIKQSGQLVADVTFSAPSTGLPPAPIDDSPILAMPPPPRPCPPPAHSHHHHHHGYHAHPHRPSRPSPPAAACPPGSGVDIQNIISQLDQYMAGGGASSGAVTPPPCPPAASQPMTIIDALLEIQRIQEQIVSSGAPRSVATAPPVVSAPAAPRSFAVPKAAPVPPMASSRARDVSKAASKTSSVQGAAHGSGAVDSEPLENLCKVLESFITTIGGDSGGAAGKQDSGTSA